MQRIAIWLTEYFIRKGIVPEAEREVYEYGFAITICTIASTLGLLLLGLLLLGLLLGQFLGGAVLIVILHLSVLRRGVSRLHTPALLPDDVRRAPGRARLLAPPLPALGAGGPRRPAPLHPNKQYLLENKKALILRSALSCLYAKAHYRPAS